MVCTMDGTSYPERRIVDRSSVTQTWYSSGAVMVVVLVMVVVVVVVLQVVIL